MKALVLYDSFFGNTEKIAQAIGRAIGSGEVIHVSTVKPEHLTGLDLLIVGSPTRSFNASPAITNMLKEIPINGLKGIKAAVFDTRFPDSVIAETKSLAFFVKLWGRAAFADKHIEDLLKKKSGELAVPSMGFYVTGTEGPLMDGEVKRAEQWGVEILTALETTPESSQG
ncbi:MAG: flavodoxin family protein [Anaerolineae bacterium]|nr:flavodoxin family protein [Anaerolineae bacterium]